MTSGSAWCLTYDQAVPNGDGTTTLYTWAPPASIANAHNYAVDNPYMTALLTDKTLQKQTLCMAPENFPFAIDPNIDPNTLVITVQYDIQGDLGTYLNDQNATLWDISSNNGTNLFSYAEFGFFCLSDSTSRSMQFNVLCYEADFGTLKGNFSLTPSGALITPDTQVDYIIVTFGVDLVALQVSRAIQALAGIFACICVVIIVFLVKSKWF